MRVSIYAITAEATWLFLHEHGGGDCSNPVYQLAKLVELAIA
jgi:hypothetical protein